MSESETGAEAPDLVVRSSKISNLSWGIGTLGTIAMINSISVLYLFFLSSIIGLPPALAGTLILVSKIVDAVSDPIMGWLSDKTDTRWGRRRPFMFVASFFCAGSMIVLFTVPDFADESSKSAFVLTGLIFYSLSLTMFNVPYLAMPAEMTDDYNERNHIMSHRALFLLVGAFLGSSLAGLLLREFGGGQAAYEIVSILIGIVVFISMIIAAAGTSGARYTVRSRSTLPALNQIRLFAANKPFLILAGVKAVQFLQLSASSAVSLFFFIGILKKDTSLLFPFGIAISISAILSLRVWLPLINKYGKKQAFMGGVLLQAFVYLSWLLASPDETMAVFMIRAFCIGILSGGILICGQSMIVDTIEYDRRLSGLNREGLYSSVFSFIEKSAHALGPFIVGLVLSLYGYDASLPKGAPQPEATDTAYFIGMAILPAVCSLLMMIGLIFYRLDADALKQTKIHALGARDGS